MTRDTAERWRNLAEEMRANAEGLNHAETREIMLRNANDLDAMAEAAERRRRTDARTTNIRPVRQ
jgi:hypothetical protein